MIRQKGIFMFTLAFVMLLCSCGDSQKKVYTEAEEISSETVGETDKIDMYEKGYNLPIENSEKEEAEADCKAAMELIQDIYTEVDKGEDTNVAISDETILQMKKAIKNTGRSVVGSEQFSVMENYQQMDKFLLDSEQGKKGSVILYKIDREGGIGRQKYIYDGADMYLLSARSAWNDENRPRVTYVSYNRIKEWRYTQKGWFAYELCVPEPPEVTEIVNGSCMLRIKPSSDECKEMSSKCVSHLGYKGNNLLCSNWNLENLENLDYNGMYEYLYEMKHGERFHSDHYPNGIPKEEFENVIMDYLPVTAEQIREWAVFDEEHQTYAWVRLGCGNYVPTAFGTSLPEVICVKENSDGTVTLTIDAVCDMTCNDAVMTHELMVCFAEDGSFKYLGNKILDNGIQDIPTYQYRLK